MDKVVTAGSFSRAYRESCFLEWYQLGKPNITDYWLRMSKDVDGSRPSKVTLSSWKKRDGWEERAKIQDGEIEKGIVEETIAEKVEMLKRHARTGRNIQEIALEYLEENKGDLTAHAAVRLLQVGVEMERDSVGVPEALEKMSKLDDDSLLSEIVQIVGSSEVTIEQLEAEIDVNSNS